ncbi:MAG: hypothetical protein ACQEWV_20175 [Bacillota bacterium]
MLEINQNFIDIFLRLRTILCDYKDHLVVKADTKENYYLNSKHIMEHNNQNLFLGAVQKELC